MIPKPVVQVLNKDGTVYFGFEDDKIPEGSFFVRGALHFPTMVGDGVEGHALIGAQSVRTGNVVVFESVKWLTVEPFFDKSYRKMMHKGLASWLNPCYATYLCDTYYWHGNTDTHRKYLLQIIRCNMIKPQPHMSEIWWNDPKDAHATLLDWFQRKKVAIDNESQLWSDVQMWIASNREVEIPSVQALLTLVKGFETQSLTPYLVEDDDDE